jgi:hypothetical protein
MTHVFFFFLLPCLDGGKKNLPPIFRNDVMGATRRKEKKYFVLPSLSPPAIVLPRYPQALVTLVYIDPVPLLTSKDKNVRVYHFYFVVLYYKKELNFAHSFLCCLAVVLLLFCLLSPTPKGRENKSRR